MLQLLVMAALCHSDPDLAPRLSESKAIEALKERGAVFNVFRTDPLGWSVLDVLLLGPKVGDAEPGNSASRRHGRIRRRHEATRGADEAARPGSTRARDRRGSQALAGHEGA